MLRTILFSCTGLLMGSLLAAAQAAPPWAVVGDRAGSRAKGAASDQTAEAQASDALAGRLPASEAASLVREEACGEVYDDCETAFDNCLTWLADIEPLGCTALAEGQNTHETPESLEAAELACEQQGVLRARLPLCIEALAMYLHALRDSDAVLAQVAGPLGQHACHPSTLCQL